MSHDTGQDVDWRTLAATISPRSPRLSAAGDLAYVATDDAILGGRVRIVRLADGADGAIEPGPAAGAEHTPRWSPSGRLLAFVVAGADVDEVHVVAAADGSTCTTMASGEGWRVDDLEWIDECFLAAIVAPRNSDSAVGLGSLRGAAGNGPMTWDNHSGRRSVAALDGRTGHLELFDTGRATVWEMCPLERDRCPPVVAIHRGPANLWTRAASVGAAALAWSGYPVILPNQRGSVGRGQAFARANLGDPAGRELDDVLSAVAMCRRRGLVLDRPPGVVGGSYGGYLTVAAAVLRGEVAAAVVMYGHPDLISARFGSNNPAFYDILLGGPPANGTLPLYVERSPVFHAHGGVPPTLILHGDGDRRTPVGQADELFRALLDHDVPAELVVYPGEGHGLRSPSAQLDAWARTIAWFDRHVKNETGR